MNTKNLVVIFVVISANLIAFFWGGYNTLSPVMFLAGLMGATLLSAWTAIRMETKSLVSFVAATILVASMDEYAHTSVGTLTYFDHAIPSPLTVLAWSLLMMFILTTTRLMMKFHLLSIIDWKMLRTLPALASIVLVSTSVVRQGYVHIFKWTLVLVYVTLGLASLYYSNRYSLKWNLLLMISSLTLGFFTEFTGALEGLWTFRYAEPVSLFIVFSWPLRFWAVGALCLLFNVDLSKNMTIEI